MKTRPCSKCGLPIIFRNVGGKIGPVDPQDRKRHWYSCMVERKKREQTTGEALSLS